MTLNETPSSNRLHIGIFGRTNSGKSSFINALTGQNVSIVADVSGTTTDPVYKPMEINPLGPCVLIDTAGFDDDSTLGAERIEKTRLAAKKTDIAILLVAADELIDFSNKLDFECEWYNFFVENKTPVLIVINKMDLVEETEEILRNIFNNKLFVKFRKPVDNDSVIGVICAKGNDASQNHNIDKVKSALSRMLPEDFEAPFITGNLVSEEDVVLLIMPQDIQAPKGRLILPQVQTIRELLDKKCIVISATTDKMLNALATLKNPPKLIITDSQVFDFVYKNKPTESMLTSFSVLFAAYKGDIKYYLEGAKAIDSLTENSKVLIAECCTHAPLSEDIGREKIPKLLRKRVGQGLTIDMVSGTDFPENPEGYDLIIQCGACMFNRKYVLSRIGNAKKCKVPMTNYGVTIAHITGILDKIQIT